MPTRWTAALVAAIILVTLVATVVHASPGREPGPATVAVVQANEFLLPRTILTPTSLYPLGKANYKVVARMLDRAAMLATGTSRIKEAWLSIVSPNDRVAILIDAQLPPVSLALLDALIDRLVTAGVRPGNIIVWADSETSLFSAGLMVRRDPDGVKTMGADSEGFRGGISRIVLDHCDTLINFARLRADRRIGIWGATANQTACVPRPRRFEMLGDQRQLPAAAARPSVKLRAKMHILDALQPNYALGGVARPPYWDCGKLLMSVDCVALDVVGKQVIEDKRAEVADITMPVSPTVTYLQEAHKLHRLGQSDPSQITAVTDAPTDG